MKLNFLKYQKCILVLTISTIMLIVSFVFFLSNRHLDSSLNRNPASVDQSGLDPSMPLTPQGYLGEVRYSVLPIAQFQKIYGTGWVKFDGSSLAGTDLCREIPQTIICQQGRIPALSGHFLKLAIDENSVGSIEDWTTGIPKNPFSGNTANDGLHTHTLNPDNLEVNMNIHPVNSGNNAGYINVPGPSYRKYKTTGTYGSNHTHSLSITGGGDGETKPKNIALNVFIKVNNEKMSKLQVLISTTDCGEKECEALNDNKKGYACYKGLLNDYEAGKKLWSVGCLSRTVKILRTMLTQSKYGVTDDVYYDQLIQRYPDDK